MRSLTLASSENGVTRVTRVTNLVNQLKTLNFLRVTRELSFPYTPCNRGKPCNGMRTNVALLVAFFRRGLRMLTAPVSGQEAAS